MSIVGLDLSLTCTGLARIHPDGQAYTWHITSTGKRGDTLTDRALRIHRMAGQILADIGDNDQIVIEAPSHGQPGGSTWDRAGLWWAVVSALHRRDIPVCMVSPTTRAKWATGTGRGDKAAVAVAMSRLFPDVELSNSDETDALALAHIGAVLAGYSVPTLARHTIDSLPPAVAAWATEVGAA